MLYYYIPLYTIMYYQLWSGLSTSLLEAHGRLFESRSGKIYGPKPLGALNLERGISRSKQAMDLGFEPRASS